MTEPKVAIITVNWNGWKDTIECLESLTKLNYVSFNVIVCDNGSQDDSVAQITKWLDANTKIRVQLIETKKNLGFAGGNNVGIKQALEVGCDYIWLLNNDTVVDKDALKHLVIYAQEHRNTICGSKLMYYDNPAKVQALGNKLNTYLGTTEFIVEEQDIDQIDYLVGAAMLIPQRVFEEVGLLSEEYFLYYEEADLWQKCKGKYDFRCVLNSLVYHKEGAAIGANNKQKAQKSLIGDFYSIRNRILFMKKYYQSHMWTVYAGLMVTVLRRIFRGQGDRVNMVFRLITNSKMTYEEYLIKYIRN